MQHWPPTGSTPTTKESAVATPSVKPVKVPPMEKCDPWISVELARRRIQRYLNPTPLMRGRPFPGTKVRTFYKLDHFRRTGAYKERGALNALLCLPKDVAKAGVIAASAGNHAQALAYHGTKLGIHVTVVMPVTAPIVKVQNCRGYGASVVLFGNTFDEAKEEAFRLAAERKLKYVNGFDDPDVISGAGTCGLEILDQLPSVDVVIIPVGGGGLLAGAALAIKRLNPKVKIIGVESDRCAGVSNALKNGKPVFTPVGAGGTLADGLAVSMVGTNTFQHIQRYVDRMVVVPEKAIARAILHMLEVEKLMVEGAGATGVAAIMSGLLDAELEGKNVVTVVTGGNIDITMLGRVINQGLYASSRLHMFDVAISNRIGGVATFAECLRKTGASIKNISQETPLVNDVHVTTLHMQVETIDDDHWQRVVKEMLSFGFVLKQCDYSRFGDVDLSKL